MNISMPKSLLLSTIVLMFSCAKEVVEEAPAPAEEVVAPVDTSELVPVIEADTVEAPEMPMEVPMSTIEVPGTEGGDLEMSVDSTSYWYMIRPDDFLSKIAEQEYGDRTVWRQIYNWNRERIGRDPNLIYPYNELELFKPDYEVEETVVDYVTHVVQAGENLWTIAISEYGDGRAWSILFWDNEAELNSNSGMLKIGMELRIRTQLWGDR